MSRFGRAIALAVLTTARAAGLPAKPMLVTGFARAAGLLLLLAAGARLGAQAPEPGQTMFALRFEETMPGQGIRYSMLIESQYALSFLLDGSLKFDPRARSSLDLYRLRGGFLGLKPGEKLDFYAIEETASGSGEEVGFRPCIGKHVLSRDGRRMSWTDGKASLFETRRTLKGVQYSEQAEATLLRTPQGAILTWSPHTVYSGCEFLSSPLFTNGFTAAERAGGIGSFVFSEADLRDWSGIQRSKQGRVDAGGADASVSLKVAFMGSPVQQVEDEMIFVASAAYDAWIPAPLAERMPGVNFSPPASKLEITVKIQPKQGGGEARKDKIYFSLEDVARHKGRCGNYPRNGMDKDDLRFAAEQSSGIVVDGPKDAHTTEEVAEATIAIEATDTAAYGKLTARASALKLKALYKPTNTYALVVPRDDDGNKIADAWERQMNISPQPNVNADKEAVAGQERAGDGLTVFDEYRGLVVLENGAKTFKRFNPLVKEVFVLDPAGLFEFALWKKLTQIVAYKIDDSMIAGGSDEVASRVVNFNSDDPDRYKYAIRLVSLPAAGDPDGAASNRMGFTDCGYCTGNKCDECKSPKDARSCNLLPERIAARVNQAYLELRKALSDPASSEASSLAASVARGDFPPSFPRKALDALSSPAARALLTKQLQAQLVIHEVGHAVSLQDHDGAPPEGTEQTVRSCPMFYPGDRSYWRFVVLQILFKADAAMAMQYKDFCRGMSAYRSAGYDCFTRINVADW